MTKIARTICATATALALGSAAHATIHDPGFMTAETAADAAAQIILATAPPRSDFQGNWYIAPNGCAYSRSQAPGYPPMWILIQNPHHLGLPDKHSGCANTL